MSGGVPYRYDQLSQQGHETLVPFYGSMWSAGKEDFLRQRRADFWLDMVPMYATYCDQGDKKYSFREHIDAPPLIQ
jgi:hypothetical protein